MVGEDSLVGNDFDIVDSSLAEDLGSGLGSGQPGSRRKLAPTPELGFNAGTGKKGNQQRAAKN